MVAPPVSGRLTGEGRSFVKVIVISSTLRNLTMSMVELKTMKSMTNFSTRRMPKLHRYHLLPPGRKPWSTAAHTSHSGAGARTVYVAKQWEAHDEWGIGRGRQARCGL